MKDQSFFGLLLESSDFAKILLAGFLGALIGLEREFAKKDPSLKTFTILCIGSCLYGILAIKLAGNQLAEVARTIGQVAAGVGFLGAGAIFKSESKVLGLTSGALIWMCAGVGLAVGVGLTQLAVEVTLLAIVLIYFMRLLHWFLRFRLSRYR